MWEMLLKMTGITLLFFLVTAGVWLFCRKQKPNSTWLKILIGVIFGACSVASTHFGPDVTLMRLNLSSAGALSAGLFFSPLSGLIAGLIGGIERYLAGELWGIGTFTTLICSLNTCLSGVIAAVLSRVAYRGRRPSVPHAFLLGALVEVLHMYSILLIKNSVISAAYYVVRGAALPMIFFTASVLALCSGLIRKLSGEQSDLGWGVAGEKVSLSVLFQRVLLFVTVALFLVNYLMTWQFHTRRAREEATSELAFLTESAVLDYQEIQDTDFLLRALESRSLNSSVFILTNGDQSWLTLAGFTETGIDPEDAAFLAEAPEDETFVHSFSSIGKEFTMLCRRKALGDGFFLTVMGDMGDLYQSRDDQMIENTLSDILLFTVIYILVLILVEHLVLRNLQRVNTALARITAGKLDEKVWVRSSSEFSELSDDINTTVGALRGYIESAEKKMDEELKLAASIQESALPRNFHLPSEHIELYAMMIPAKQVGGDFYDFFFIDNGLLCLVIADVSGKGIPASLFMMRAKTSIKYYAHSCKSPAEVLESVNNALCEDNDADMFVTVWLGILDLKTGIMRCSNAGHEYPVLMRAGGEYELLKDRHGMILATFEDVRMKEYEVCLQPGDRFFVYTDGVAEAMNEKREQFGTARIIERLNRRKPFDQKQLLEGMLQDIRNYAGTAEQFDDITMLGFVYKG